MDDLFTADQLTETEETLRAQLTQKWTEKFPTADPELIKTKVDSDVYVKFRDRQFDELRADYLRAQEEIQKGKTVDDLLDQLNRRDPSQAPPKPEEKTPTMGQQEIERLVEAKIEQKRLAEIETKNFTEVQNKLRERYGQNSGQMVSEAANTLNLTKDEVNSLAKRSPEAFFRMLGMNQPQEKDLFMAPPRSDVRNDNFAPRTTKRTWNYYQALKAKEPTKYWDPKTQLQMHKDSEVLGSAFEDGDFNL